MKNEYDNDWIVLLIGVIAIIIFAYAVTAPAHEVGWIKWTW